MLETHPQRESLVLRLDPNLKEVLNNIPCSSVELMKFVEKTSKEFGIKIDVTTHESLQHDDWSVKLLTNEDKKKELYARMETGKSLFDAVIEDLKEHGTSETDADMFDRTQRLKKHLFQAGKELDDGKGKIFVVSHSRTFVSMSATGVDSHKESGKGFRGSTYFHNCKLAPMFIDLEKSEVSFTPQ